MNIVFSLSFYLNINSHLKSNKAKSVHIAHVLIWTSNHRR